MEFSLDSSLNAVHLAAVKGQRNTLNQLIIGNHFSVNSVDHLGRTPLIFTVLADRVECMHMLLKLGATVNQADTSGRTALHWAAHKGNYKAIKALLSKGALWSLTDQQGQTPLHLCTRNESGKALTFFLRQLAPGEVDVQDNNKRTALHLAASYGHLEQLQYLLGHESNIGIPDIQGRTALHWCAACSQPSAVACVQLLLETTPSVLNWQDYEGLTALHLAVSQANADVVRLICSQRKCNINALDNQFRTPLHWAAVLGMPEIVQLLLDMKVDYTSSDSNGATPLHYAVQHDHHNVVEVFMSHASAIDNVLDIEGRTALIWAASKQSDASLRVMLKYGVDCSVTDKHGETALHAAAYAGHVSTVDLLLDYGCDIDCTDAQKHTPLFRATERGRGEVVSTLVKRGARLDVFDSSGRTPLHWAALGGHAHVCQILLYYGIDPDWPDNTGRTALPCAAYSGHVNCMCVLMEHKASLDAADNEGMTALHWACSKGHMEAAKLLLDNGANPNMTECSEERYTSLDYALMNNQSNLAQLLMEFGGVSITTIRDIAASKIQAFYRGYRVRNELQGYRDLMLTHEKLKAARKCSERKFTINERQAQSFDASLAAMKLIDDGGAKEDSTDSHRLKRITRRSAIRKNNVKSVDADLLHAHVSESKGAEAEVGSSETCLKEMRSECDSDTEEKNLPLENGEQTERTRLVFHEQREDVKPLMAGKKPKHDNDTEEGNEHDDSEVDKHALEPSSDNHSAKKHSQREQGHSSYMLLYEHKCRKQRLQAERKRVNDVRRKWQAAVIIQRAWKYYRFFKGGLLADAKESAKRKRLRLGKDAWNQTMAALTIQLAWRKYSRRKLMSSLTPRDKILVSSQSPRVAGATRLCIAEKIYTEQPRLTQSFSPRACHNKPQQDRPIYEDVLPMPASVSFNFAVETYLPAKDVGIVTKQSRRQLNAYDPLLRENAHNMSTSSSLSSRSIMPSLSSLSMSDCQSSQSSVERTRSAQSGIQLNK